MSFYITPVRRLCIVRACGLFVLAIVVALFPIVFKGQVDSAGRVGGYCAAGLLALGGLLNLWWARRAPPDAAVTPIFQLTPLREQIRVVQRAFWLSVTIVPLGIIWWIYDLWQLESGAAQRVSVWAPVAMIYEYLGFWPSVASMLFLGIALPALLAFKRHGLRSRASTNENQAGRTKHEEGAADG
jgi:hypothetical protein